jgi:hypothetical protein
MDIISLDVGYENAYKIISSSSSYEQVCKTPPSMPGEKTLILSPKWHQPNYSVDHRNFIATYSHIIDDSSSAHQSKHVVVKLDSLQQVELPAELSEIAQVIEESKYILELTDNFDEEGAKACEFATWERAVRFLVEYSGWVFKSFHYVIDCPKIYDGPHGSIDMLWRTDRYRWLINFPEDSTQPASFYGDDFKLDQLKGTFNPSHYSPRRFFMLLLGAN